MIRLSSSTHTSIDYVGPAQAAKVLAAAHNLQQSICSAQAHCRPKHKKTGEKKHQASNLCLTHADASQISLHQLPHQGCSLLVNLLQTHVSKRLQG